MTMVMELARRYRFSRLKSSYKIPPNLPFPKGGEDFPLLTKGDEGGLD